MKAWIARDRLGHAIYFGKPTWRASDGLWVGMVFQFYCPRELREQFPLELGERHQVNLTAVPLGPAEKGEA